MGFIDVDVSGLTSLDHVNSILFNFPGGAQRATWNAAKRAGIAGRKEGAKYVARVYNISRSSVRKNSTVKVKQTGSGAGTTSVKIIYGGQLVDLLEFKPTVSSDGVRYEAKRGELHHLPHAFEVQRFGKRIFKRVKRSRLPIRKIKGPSVPHMMRDPEVGDPMSERIAQIFRERLEREIDYILKNG